MSVQELTREGLNRLGPTAITLARLEGLDAHANAVARRLDFVSKDLPSTTSRQPAAGVSRARRGVA
jgi:hypothetical protein